jgi:RHS repeat-associated protein
LLVVVRSSSAGRVARGFACAALALSLIAAGCIDAATAHADKLSTAEIEKLPEMAEWVYRNSPVKDPVPCGAVCSHLWVVEHEQMPNAAAAQELWNQLGWFEVDEGLWPSLSELKEGIGIGGETSITSGAFTIGWHVKGTDDKWMAFEQEGPPGAPEERWCDSLGSYNEKLVPPGVSYGATVESGHELPPQPVTQGWTYVGGQNGCPFGGVGYYSEKGPVATCTAASPPPPMWTGWLNSTEVFGVCEEPEYDYPRLKTNVDDALRTQPFSFSRPEDYSAQTATKVVEDREPSSPATPAVVETQLKEALETKDPTLNLWLKFYAAGEGTSPTQAPQASEELGTANPGEPGHEPPCKGDPVNCATGNEIETQTDLAVGGRGVGLDLTRTYNSQAAAAGEHGVFGYGWTSSFGDRLAINASAGTVTVYQANGSTVVFTGNPATAGELTAPEWAQSKLVVNSEGGFRYTLPDQQTFNFNSGGRLLSEADRDGNTTSLSYSGAGRLETITDPAGRKITLAYNSEGLVESAKDPLGHIVKYTYEAGNLASVTQPGESALRWQFKYDGSHELTTLTDGRGNKTINEYNGAHQVTAQTDPASRKLSFAYREESPGFVTEITNHATGAVTKEQFNGVHELIAITHGYGTSLATTDTSTYNGEGYIASETNGDGYTTSYTYDAAGDRTSMVDPDDDETKWTFDSTHDVDTITTPKGETTTIKRESHGNPEAIERPAPGGKTQVTKYKYGSYGELESVTDPLERTTKYGYDSHGDRTSETDPEGDKRTWEYNEDSQETATVSPRGNAAGAEASKFTTKIERDLQGRPTTVTDPLGHTTKYVYDADGNLESMTDGNKNTTTYTYDPDNEPIKTKEANGTVTETEYDGAGQVVGQIDGNKHTTKYVRNVLEQVTEVVDPLGHKTIKEYDRANNLMSLVDAEKRTTSYRYDPANRLVEVSFSDGKTATLRYGYDADGNRTSMIDGSGETTYAYDQLDRLTESKDGHGDKVSYEYDLDNEQTKMTYPNAKAVSRAYDKDGRLEAVTDWLSHVFRFSYDEDSNLTATTFPAEGKGEDKYVYNDADQMSEITMKKGTQGLLSFVYTRDGDGQVKSISSDGPYGDEKPSYEYDANERLIDGASTAYEYDAANNPTKIGAGKYAYNSDDELETGPSTKYVYNEVGQRTSTEPSGGSASVYHYDQAGNLLSVTRAKEGASPAIEDVYTYNGEDLRTSQTIAGTTSYLTWDTSESVPLVLSDQTNSYIYGPGGLPVEQVTASEAFLYLHHDEQGSTRLITSHNSKVEAYYAYGPYGALTQYTGTATTPLGYDGQYTSSDTGLIYMRARTYDPATGQFLSPDPLEAITGEPYNYAGDDPVNRSDPSGLVFGIPGTPSLEEIGEGIAGWGDTITFGATNWVREELGIDNVDACSGAYQAGGLAGLVTGVLIPGGGEAEAGAEGISISAKIAGQMETRGWTEESIQEAIESGDQVQAVNKATGNPATRYINPRTGQSVVVDDVTKEVIHVGGPGFKYGPGSGDIP